MTANRRSRSPKKSDRYFNVRAVKATYFLFDQEVSRDIDETGTLALVDTVILLMPRRDLTQSAKAVAEAMAVRTTSQLPAICFASIRTLCCGIRLSRSTVSRALKQLEATACIYKYP